MREQPNRQGCLPCFATLHCNEAFSGNRRWDFHADALILPQG
jgi:hypothetical protein